MNEEGNLWLRSEPVGYDSRYKVGYISPHGVRINLTNILFDNSPLKES